MNKYTRIIEWSDEDQCYLGSLPELLEGHCTHGESPKEVNKNLDDCEELALQNITQIPQRGIRVFTPARRRSWVNKNNIASLRESLGMSQQEFAINLGSSITTVRKWEQGSRNPSGAAARLLDIIKKHPELISE
ncbi:MAG: type II toxin-antitoxin system MqsA family antitoxin [Akkermansia sp.]